MSTRWMRAVLGTAIAAASMAGTAAHAQTRTTAAYAPPAPEAGFYAGIGLGRAQPRDACGSLGGAGFAGSCDDRDTTWNFNAGYQFNRNAAVELGYVDFGNVTASGTAGGAAVGASSSAKALELTGIAMFPVAQAISLYGKAGIFRWNADASRSGPALLAASDRGNDFTFGLGAQYSFTRNIAALLEWQRYNNVGVASAGESDINVMRVGLRYKF